jgi:DNA-directed RNA polymerase specialized sigma24 family protein
MTRRSHAAAPTALTASMLGGDHAPATTTPTAARELALLEASADFDERARAAAQRLERRQADIQLRDELARTGFTGPAWDRFADELGRYGLGVMKAWLATTKLFEECKKRNCWPGSAPIYWDEDDRAGLANEIVAHAIKTFRDRGLVAGGWNPAGGASLKTYFVGACIYAFPNLYRQWRREYEHWSNQSPIDEVMGELADVGYDPTALALIRLQLWAGFEKIPQERVKRAILLEELGYTKAEIARALGATLRAVEGWLAHQRRRGQQADDDVAFEGDWND